MDFGPTWYSFSLACSVSVWYWYWLFMVLFGTKVCVHDRLVASGFRPPAGGHHQVVSYSTGPLILFRPFQFLRSLGERRRGTHCFRFQLGRRTSLTFLRSNGCLWCGVPREQLQCAIARSSGTLVSYVVLPFYLMVTVMVGQGLSRQAMWCSSNTSSSLLSHEQSATISSGLLPSTINRASLRVSTDVRSSTVRVASSTTQTALAA